MNPPRKPSEPGESDRDAVERLVDSADHEIRALLRPHRRISPSGIVTQVVNVAPDYEGAHVVAVNPWCPYPAGRTFHGIVPYDCVPAIVRLHLLAGIVAWGMN